MAIVTFKCKNCGGELTYSPEEGAYVCEYCDSRFTEEELENGPVEDTGEQTIEDGAVIYNCPNCGAEIITDATTAATFCFYCHNPVILTGRLDGAYLPQALIPFEVGKDEAITRFLKWTAGKRFVPKSFFSKESIEKMTGVYFPFWMMEADVDVNVIAEAKQTAVSRSGSRESTKTDVYQVKRNGTIHLDDLSRNALRKADRELVEAVLPFRTDGLKPFALPYLSGFQAEKRDIDQTELEQQMDEDVRTYTKSVISDSISSNYSSVSYRQLDINPTSKSWKYALLPVWVLTYHRKGDKKLYYYALNGQTGQIAGELPVDNGKVLLSSLLVAAVVFLAALLGGFLL